MTGADYDATHFNDPVRRARFDVMERFAVQHLHDCTRVLDLGCGTGRLTQTLPAKSVFGLDLSRSMLGAAVARKLCVVLGDAHALPFRAASFDGIISTDSAFTVLDHSRALAECARVLQRGGKLVLHHPTHALWTPRYPLQLTTSSSGDPDKTGLQLIAWADGHGLALEDLRLWRWLRVRPYLVRMPARPQMLMWNHGVFVFRKR